MNKNYFKKMVYYNAPGSHFMLIKFKEFMHRYHKSMEKVISLDWLSAECNNWQHQSDDDGEFINLDNCCGTMRIANKQWIFKSEFIDYFEFTLSWIVKVGKVNKSRKYYESHPLLIYLGKNLSLLVSPYEIAKNGYRSKYWLDDTFKERFE